MFTTVSPRLPAAPRVRAAIFSLAASALLSVSAFAQDWKPLFNGENLDGWKVVGGPETGAGYRIENGEIVGYTAGGGPNMFLCTDRDYADFELEYECRMVAPKNSGVQIRTLRTPKPEDPAVRWKPVNGPQVEFDQVNPGSSGWIFGEGTKFRWLYQNLKQPERTRHELDFTQWVKFRVVAQGPRLQVWVNGKQVEDITHEELYKTHAKGLIGLQVHEGGGKGEIRWRNVRIRELPSAQPAP